MSLSTFSVLRIFFLIMLVLSDIVVVTLGLAVTTATSTTTTTFTSASLLLVILSFFYLFSFFCGVVVLFLVALLLFVRNGFTISVKFRLTGFSLKGYHVAIGVKLRLTLLFFVWDHVTIGVKLWLMLLSFEGDHVAIGVKLRLTLLSFEGDHLSIGVKLRFTWLFRTSLVLFRGVFLDLLSVLGSISNSPVSRIAWLCSQVYLRCLRNNVFIILSLFLGTSESLGSLGEGDTGLSLQSIEILYLAFHIVAASVKLRFSSFLTSVAFWSVNLLFLFTLGGLLLRLFLHHGVVSCGFLVSVLHEDALYTVTEHIFRMRL